MEAQDPYDFDVAGEEVPERAAAQEARLLLGNVT